MTVKIEALQHWMLPQIEILNKNLAAVWRIRASFGQDAFQVELKLGDQFSIQQKDHFNMKYFRRIL